MYFSDVQDLCYKKKTERSTCETVAIVSVLVILMTILAKKDAMGRVKTTSGSQAVQSVSGMISRLGEVGTASARRGATAIKAMRVMTGSGDDVVCSASKLIPNAPSSFRLYGGMQNSVPETVMSQVANQFVRDTSNSKTPTLNMFFAPWCSHCQNTLHAISNMGSQPHLSKVSLNIVNGSALSESVLRGSMSPDIPQIMHYPTFFTVDNGFTKTYGSLTEMLESVSPPSQTSDDASPEQAPPAVMGARSVNRQMDMRNMSFQNDRLMDGGKNSDILELKLGENPSRVDPFDSFF